jgi:hypothetical protein
VRAGADPEVEVGSGDRELLEEGVGHFAVVVLSGVDEDLAESAPQDAREGGGLHELRPGAHHGENRGAALHAFASSDA